jgi:hypothetical protein
MIAGFCLCLNPVTVMFSVIRVPKIPEKRELLSKNHVFTNTKQLLLPVKGNHPFS